MGSAEEFDGFCRDTHADVVGAVYLLCGDLGVAEQLAQTAFERAWVRWDAVGAMTSPRGWVHQVAFNLARSGLRRRSAERRALARLGPAEPREAVDTAAVLTIRRALLDLPPRQREAVVHRHHLGHTIAETATLMGVSEGAVKQLTLRATRQLRGVLAEPTATEADDDR